MYILHLLTSSIILSVQFSQNKIQETMNSELSLEVFLLETSSLESLNLLLAFHFWVPFTTVIRSHITYFLYVKFLLSHFSLCKAYPAAISSSRVTIQGQSSGDDGSHSYSWTNFSRMDWMSPMPGAGLPFRFLSHCPPNIPFAYLMGWVSLFRCSKSTPFTVYSFLWGKTSQIVF